MNHKFKKLVFYIGIVVLITVLIYFTISYLRSYQLNYKITTNTDKVISINIDINKGLLSKSKFITLSKDNLKIFDQKCEDSKGNPISIKSDDSFVKIGPIKSSSFKYSYKIRPDYGAWEDLVTFSGVNVLLLPYDKDLNHLGVTKLTFESNCPKDWVSIMPFTENNKTIIKNPTWFNYFNISNSNFTFGKLEKTEINKDLSVMIDRTILDSFSKETLTGVENLYDFYSNLFDNKLSDYKAVFIRDSNSQFSYGVSGGSMGMAMNPKSLEDWKALSHSMFQAFYDKSIKAENLRFSPNQWLTKGLASYYENIAMEKIPQSLLQKFSINPHSSLTDLYNRYLYFQVSEPGTYTLSPSSENQLSGGQAQFYYYTKAPLIIYAIEEMAKAKGNSSDSIIGYLIDHSKDKSINMADLMVKNVGSNEEKVRNILSGSEIIPFPVGNYTKDKPEQILQQLNNYEALLATWYLSTNPNYKYDEIALLNPVKILKLTNSNKITFAPTEIERLVYDYSPTLFMLLRQNALRASVCSISDLTIATSRLEMRSNHNIKKWRKYIKKNNLSGT